MTARASAELIVDLSEAVSGRSLDRRVLMLRRATNLFLSYGRRLNDQQIGTFDDVLLKLVDCVDVQSLVQLSSSLADLDPAPSQTVRCLARHADVSVAYPVLHRSHSFGTEELRELASHLGRKHLVAVAGRQTLDEAVTDILLKRGGNEICRVLAKNAGARFSEDGFKLMVASAKSNPDIAESLGLRSDIAPAMLCQLLLTMSDKQRLALLKAAPPHSRQSIREALDGIASARTGPRTQQDRQAQRLCGERLCRTPGIYKCHSGAGPAFRGPAGKHRALDGAGKLRAPGRGVPSVSAELADDAGHCPQP